MSTDQSAMPLDEPADETAAHGHRDVSGGWLRPTVFGGLDGLVTNVSLISGVGGGGVSTHNVILTGLAGLVAGAFSMATGEFISVTSQNELVEAEVDRERRELRTNPEGERAELAQMFADRGVDPELAAKVVEQISRNPDTALRLHAREELGLDPDELPSPWVAAASSFLSFAVGALVPLLPYLLGAASLGLALALASVVALAGGAVVSRLTERSMVWGASRQFLLGAVAAGATYLVGSALGGGAA
ncbi:MAG: vacuolar iron transporter family protein [Frankiales bacterium]|nr:vacuolar iron transporter family protein [Frankiales bacterium]MDX6212463.1 vacuolar iron transporter family protein [Frankiales bacterium]MDX6223246.1 vacuolar iron transporter family protein [Frankiales bacterium]